MHKLVVFFISISLFSFVNSQIVQSAELVNAIVNQSVINLKTSPSFTSEMSSQALLGTPVFVSEVQGGWCKVQTPEGYEAWTTKESIQRMNIEELQKWKAAQKLIITSYFSVLFTQASIHSSIVSDIVLGDIVLYLAKAGNFYKVMLPDKRIAYLLRKNAIPFDQWLNTRKPTSTNIISIAKSFIGFPYLWGGTSIKGLDCSGFTKTCFYMNGIILRRDASQQALTGKNIDIKTNLDSLKPADLLFFGSINQGKEHVVHVAIYLGNGEFIHSSGTVRIGSLLPDKPNYDAYNAKRLLHAQRILSNVDIDQGIVSIKLNPMYQ